MEAPVSPMNAEAHRNSAEIPETMDRPPDVWAAFFWHERGRRLRRNCCNQAINLIERCRTVTSTSSLFLNPRVLFPCSDTHAMLQ